MLIAAAFAFFLAPGGMTLHTILEIGNAFFQVLTLNVLLGVLVTAVASILLEVGRHVTGLALAPAAFAMVERERVIERGPFPGRSGVALRAIQTKLPQVFLRIGVAAHARLRRAFIHIVDVALGARHRDMRPGQLEHRQVVIELGVFPIGGVVALRTVRAKCALMRPIVIGLMATDARQRRAFIDIVDVAFGALNRDMLAL